MNQVLHHLSDQELLDRLADLTDHLVSCRGLNASYEFCKMDIEETQEEIAARKQRKPPEEQPENANNR